LALSLENYPSEGTDPYTSVNNFPDEIMRRDILDDLQPPGCTNIPKAPLPPCCKKCAEKKVIDYL